MRQARLVRTIALVALASSSGDEVRAQSASAAGAPASTVDCATASLYAFLRFAGRPAELSRLRATLPPRHPEGYSMKDLQDAGRRFGVRCVGVVERGGKRAPDGPRLAFMKRGEHGHFLALRPVGHTGRLVQIIDAGREPAILDTDRLYASPEWTGLVLAPSRPIPIRGLMGWLAVVSSMLIPIILIRNWVDKRRRARKRGRKDPVENPHP